MMSAWLPRARRQLISPSPSICLRPPQSLTAHKTMVRESPDSQEDEIYFGGLAPQVVPDSEDTTVYYGGLDEGMESFVTRQGFEPMSFDGECKAINREWAKRREWHIHIDSNGC